MANDPQKPQGAGPETNASTTSENRVRLALWFAVRHDMRYLSHRDTMNLWQRALVRARLPLRYSQGFNPHPRLTLPLPRSVAVASETELLVVELTQRIPSENVQGQLKPQLPHGISLLEVDYLPGKPPQPVSAAYELTLAPTVELSPLQQRIETFHAADQWPVERSARGRHPHRTFDLRDRLLKLSLQNDTVTCTVKIGPAGAARIDEIQTMLQLHPGKDVRMVRRTATEFAQGETNVEQAI